jgi:hypothetical protein
MRIPGAICDDVHVFVAGLKKNNPPDPEASPAMTIEIPD